MSTLGRAPYEPGNGPTDSAAVVIAMLAVLIVRGDGAARQRVQGLPRPPPHSGHRCGVAVGVLALLLWDLADTPRVLLPVARHQLSLTFLLEFVHVLVTWNGSAP